MVIVLHIIIVISRLYRAKSKNLSSFTLIGQMYDAIKVNLPFTYPFLNPLNTWTLHLLNILSS